MSDIVVRMRGLKARYGRQVALDIPELALEECKIHVLVGPNGSGKTTLLRAICGLHESYSGSIEVFGRSLSSLSRRDRLKTIRDMTLCLQKPYLFGTSVRKNIEYGLGIRGLDYARRMKRVEAAAKMLRLESLLERGANALSAGQIQLVSFARGLALQTRLVLLDEPLANIDTANRTQIESAILGLPDKNRTAIVATHQIDQAYRLSANVIRLENGRLAPPALENLFPGHVRTENGSTILDIEAGPSIYVVAERTGPVRASIDPTAILVSRERIVSSARNSLEGRITGLSDLGQRVALSADIGIELKAHITQESFKALEITLGDKVFLTFKASAVSVF
jgi:molybdopterin-binding protein